MAPYTCFLMRNHVHICLFSNLFYRGPSRNMLFTEMKTIKCSLPFILLSISCHVKTLGNLKI